MIDQTWSVAIKLRISSYSSYSGLIFYLFTLKAIKVLALTDYVMLMAKGFFFFFMIELKGIEELKQKSPNPETLTKVISNFDEP